MKPKHPSDSSEQIEAHKEILELLNLQYNLQLKSKRLPLNDTLFQVDGYSTNPSILCEISTHIGKLKPAQFNKIGKDILKMLLIEKIDRSNFRKIIVFVDDEAAKSFIGGESWYSQLGQYFQIEILIIKIPALLTQKLLTVQKRQYKP